MEGPQIIFEDDFLLVVDKPAGLTVNRAGTTKGRTTLQDWTEGTLEIKDKSSGMKDKKTENGDGIREEFVGRGGIVHRLDRETSGLLVIAKTPEVFAALKKQFQERTVVKKYLALVHGEVKPAEGRVAVPVGRSPFNRMRFGVFPGGREAETSYKLLRLLKLPRLLKRLDQERIFSLLELVPKTGRTHQIRVHLQYLGHPVVSDPLYAGRKQLREDRKFCPRLFLHAAFLRIFHPQTNLPWEFTLPLPVDLASVLDKLERVG